jgi:uncharacterized protein (TIGR02147 family)
VSDSKSSGRPNLYAYTNYRAFLRDLFEHLKLERARMSFRYLARKAGFASPNFFKLVMDGKRNLTVMSVPKFARALKLDSGETEFFRTLVALNQSKSWPERSRHAERLARQLKHRKIQSIQVAQYHYYAHWYMIPIREMVVLSDFREDPAWISKRLSPSITPTEAKQALADLKQLGLLVRGADGVLRQADSTIMTSDEVTSASVAQFHREMIRLGSDSIDQIAPHERDISAVTVAVSPSQAVRLKEMIQKFRREALELVSESGPDTDRIYELNLQLFPLTRKSTEDAA